MEPERAGLGPGSERARGRTATSQRLITCETGVLSRADGSAKWCQEGSCVLAAVYGPKQAGIRREDAEKAVVEVIFRPRSEVAGPAEAEAGALVRGALEGCLLLALHPRTAVQIVLQVVSTDGSLLAAAVNAATAALIDAGIPQHRLVAASSVAVTNSGELLVDPDATEEALAAAVTTAAFHYGAAPEVGDVRVAIDDAAAMLRTFGPMAPAQLAAAVALCRAGAERVAAFMQAAVAKAFARP